MDLAVRIATLRLEQMGCIVRQTFSSILYLYKPTTVKNKANTLLGCLDMQDMSLHKFGKDKTWRKLKTFRSLDRVCAFLKGAL